MSPSAWLKCKRLWAWFMCLVASWWCKWLQAWAQDAPFHDTAAEIIPMCTTGELRSCRSCSEGLVWSYLMNNRDKRARSEVIERSSPFPGWPHDSLPWVMRPSWERGWYKCNKPQWSRISTGFSRWWLSPVPVFVMFGTVSKSLIINASAYKTHTHTHTQFKHTETIQLKPNFGHNIAILFFWDD